MVLRNLVIVVYVVAVMFYYFIITECERKAVITRIECVVRGVKCWKHCICVGIKLADARMKS